GHAQGERLVRIIVLPRPFEYVAAIDLLAAQIAGLAGHAEQLLEAVVIGLELVVGDREVLDRHLGGNGGLAVTASEMSARVVIGRQEAPGDAVPVRAGTADADAGEERSEPADRQRGLRRRMT